MKRNSGYNTKQKELLLDFLIQNKDKHTNVQEISTFFSNNDAPVGITTIYRQLDKLVEQGLVRKYVLDGKTSACYQYIESTDSCHEHFHLKCFDCGQLFHINCNHLATIYEHIFDDHGFTLDLSKTVFYGKCAQCSKATAK